MSRSKLADSWSNNIVHQPWLGLARTFLSFGTLLTLTFNHTSVLFREGTGFIETPICFGASTFSLFCLFPGNLEIARWLSITILVIVASGWRPRITALFHWWISFSLNNSALILDGGDQATSILTLLLIPICLFDNRKWHWEELVVANVYDSNPRGMFRNWAANMALFSIRIQVSYIYFNAAISKFQVEEWINGTAVYYWFLNPYMGAPGWLSPAIESLVESALVVTMITWGTLIFELLLAFGIALTRKLKANLLIAGIAFHFLIAIIHGLFPFFFAMTAALILYLTPTDPSSRNVVNPLKEIVARLLSKTPAQP